jgi:nitrate reductase cytochrome c-type subunit
MKILASCSLLISLVVATAVPALAAEAPQNYDADARFAEGNPPLIPHRIEEGMKAPQCLACHWPPGKAPLCPHPVRIACTQCHLGSVADAAPTAAPSATPTASRAKGNK